MLIEFDKEELYTMLRTLYEVTEDSPCASSEEFNLQEKLEKLIKEYEVKC